MYIAFYPATYLGLGRILRARIGRLPAGLWLDGLIGALAFAALGAALLLGPLVTDTHGAPLTVATNLAYPLGDVLLLAIIAGILALTGWRLSAGWLLLALGFAVFTVADSIYLVQTAKNTYVDNGILDVGWPAGMAIIALSAWMRAPDAAAGRLEGWGVFVAPVLAAMTCVGLELADHFHRISLTGEVLATLCLIAVVLRLGLTFAENRRMLQTSRREAVTDALTGLGNRRALGFELQRRLAGAEIEPFLLAVYDLDGFKSYNDAYGHQAGDALLTRLGGRVAAALPEAEIFRLGGDEFCILLPAAGGETAAAASAAEHLSENGEGFSVGCSYGFVSVPGECADPDTAMLLADSRMYEHKGGRRADPARESQEVLLRALAERCGDLGQHNDDVTDLVGKVGAELGLERMTLTATLRAAQLHDVGKLAIPDTILNKPGPLNSQEWAFMRRHTIIGERIVASATSLRDVAPIVRATHERWDGAGYPDGLREAAIPLGARIIAVCDSFDAMTTTRPYRAGMSRQAALAELRRCAATQFDPAVVAAFERVLAADTAADPAALAA